MLNPKNTNTQHVDSHTADFTISSECVVSGTANIASTTMGDVTVTLPPLSDLPSDGVLRDFSVGHLTSGNPAIMTNMDSGDITDSTYSDGGTIKKLDFDGTDDYVSCGNGDTLQITDKLSVRAIIGVGSQGSSETFVSKYSTTTDIRSWSIQTQTGESRKVRVIVSDNGEYTDHTKDYYTTNDILGTSGYNEVGFTFDGGTLKIYVDSTEITAITKTRDDSITSIYNTSADMVIGNIEGGAQHYTGSILNVGVWDTAVLSAADFTSLYNGGSSLDPRDLSSSSGASLVSSWIWNTSIDYPRVLDNTDGNHVYLKTDSADTFVFGNTQFDLGTVNKHFTIAGIYNGSSGRWGFKNSLTLKASGHRESSWGSSSFSSMTVVPLDSEEYNNNCEILTYTSGAGARYTVQTTGSYKVSASVIIDSTGGSTWNLTGGVYKNGTALDSGQLRDGNYGSEDASFVAIPFYVDLVKGDYIDLRVDQNSLTGNLVHAMLNIELRL